MRFLLDEDLPQDAAQIARSLGLDAVSVHELERRGIADAEQLRFAAAEGRVFVTRNRRDFLRLTSEFFQAGEVHVGVVIVRRSIPGDQPARVAQAL